MNLILRKEKYILGRIDQNWLIFLGIWGEAELIWGAKAKYFLGPEEFSFRDMWRLMNHF